jgi:hypothetical protein
LNIHHDNRYSMGIEIRNTTKPGDCHCLILPHKKAGKPVHLCFHKGILGAMSDAQEIKYCSPRSFVPKQDGGLAQDIRSDNVQKMVETMKSFGEASARASSKYQADIEDDGERDMSRWRDTVSKHVIRRTPLPKERARPMTKAERQEARKDSLEAAFDIAMEKEERAAARRGRKAPVEEGWDSSRLGDYG